MMYLVDKIHQNLAIDLKQVNAFFSHQCGENCTGMGAMPVGKLSKTGKIQESYQNIYGQMSINVKNLKAPISFSSILLLFLKPSLYLINFLSFLTFPLSSNIS